MDRPSKTVQSASTRVLQNHACAQRVAVAAADDDDADDDVMTIEIDDRLVKKQLGKTTRGSKTKQAGGENARRVCLPTAHVGPHADPMHCEETACRALGVSAACRKRSHVCAVQDWLFTT